MDKHYIITISREFGSMGRPIAKRLAEILGIEFYDRDIVEKTANNLAMPVTEITEHEESAKSRFLNMGYPLGNDTAEKQDMIFKEQTKIIRELADESSCIIVGRCADFAFQNDKNCLKVHIYASYEARLRNSIDMLRLDRDTARKTIRRVDKARRYYHLHYAGYAPGDPDHLDMLINSQVFGVNGTAEALAEIVKIRFDIEE